MESKDSSEDGHFSGSRGRRGRGRRGRSRGRGRLQNNGILLYYYFRTYDYV
jgi:hypothetical protein